MSAINSFMSKPLEFPSFPRMALTTSGKPEDGFLASGITRESTQMSSRGCTNGLQHVYTYKDGDLSYGESAPEGLTASPSDVEISAVNKEGTCEYTAKPGLLTWGRETKPTTLWSIKSLKPVSAAEHDAVMSDFKQIKSAWNSASQLGSDEKTRFDSLIESGQLKEAGEMLDAKANSVFTADGQKFSDQGWNMCLTRTVETSKGHESRATTKLGPSRGSSAPSSADT